MKKILYLSLVALGMSSCTDKFLEEKMVSTITQEYFDTEQGLEQLIVGTYDALRVTKQYEQGPKVLMTACDNFSFKDANWGMYSASVWNATDKLSGYGYSLCGEYSSNGAQPLGFYPIISNCNRAIETIREGKAQGKYLEDEAYAAQRLSEALFNRAYSLYIMSTIYGEVYVPTGFITSLPSNYNYVRESVPNIYKLLIGDLRYAFDHLPDVTLQNLATEFGRVTKGAAAHFLAKLYLQRAQGVKYGSAEYGVKADGHVDTDNPKSYLGMLYKGEGVADLDSCIYFANQVIPSVDGGNGSYYQLEADYGKLFSHPLGDYSNESSKELILSCVYGPMGSADNGRYGNRLPYFFGGDYVSASWGIPEFCWEYPTKSASRVGFTNDFGFDLYVDKMADSRYQKSFHLEYVTALKGGESNSVPAANLDYYAYDSDENQTYTWTEDMAAYFNANILPSYDRASWGGRQAVANEHKMGKGDLAFAFLENTKATAIDIKEAAAQPFVLFARWIKDGNKYYYRVPIQASGKSYDYNSKSYAGLDKLSSTCCPATVKYDEPNRSNYTHYESGRDIPLFRLAETYLIRAAAQGLKGNYSEAVSDINIVRARAAYKGGEKRNEILARFSESYPGSSVLSASEKSYPYTVANDMTGAMLIDQSIWGSSPAADKEMYPATAVSTEDRFTNFILNEVAREFNQEMIYIEWLHHSGWQADRIIYHDELGSSKAGLWDSSDNLINGIGQTGNGMGMFEPYYTFKPFSQNMLDLLTDENGQPLDEAAKKAYQNYGYK